MSNKKQKKTKYICLPRIGNGFVWTVSVVEGTILCEAVGDIALALELVPFPTPIFRLQFSILYIFINIYVSNYVIVCLYILLGNAAV